MKNPNPFMETADAVEASGRRERKRRQTLDRLAETAFGLFEAHGYDAVTMEQIASAADVAKGTLYNHFPVKEALLVHHFHGELADSVPDLLAAMAGQPTFAARLRLLLHTSAQWFEDRRVYIPHYLRFRLANADHGVGGRSGMDKIMEAVIRTAQAAGEARADHPSGQLAQMLHILFFGALIRWLKQPDCDLRREFEAVLDVFLNGVCAPAGSAGGAP